MTRPTNCSEHGELCSCYNNGYETGYEYGEEEGRQDNSMYDDGYESGYNNGIESVYVPDLEQLFKLAHGLLADIAPKDSTELCPACDTKGSHNTYCIIEMFQIELESMESEVSDA